MMNAGVRPDPKSSLQRRARHLSSALLLAISLSACGDGQSFAPASSGSLVAVVTAASSSTAPVPAATATSTPTPTPTPTPTSTPTPVPTPSATPTTNLSGVLDEGDSISVFWGGNHTGIYAAAHSAVTYHGQAVGGSHLQNSGNDLAMRFAADEALHPAYVTLLIGANDMPEVAIGWSQYATAQSYIDALFTYVAKWKATGAKVALGTILPQCRAGTDNTLANTNRVTINAAIRAAVGTRIDAVIDYATDPDIGPDAAACNTAWYQDGLHPTDGSPSFAGGQGRMASIYTNVLDQLMQ